ncbi:cation-translocating P-type ATPase [Oleiagrimonas sp. C23AA]|uniref:cation-translocating P-type ATPase n=1 Tax=Oleiagrimonas sp. C23AA TaxID=2719047 RepID=UPI00141F93FF|nr:cation-translocating P-type ATPase [Oleiagrimonas sp. C23AA]NII10018.1 cation-translocating P-type ATPase [Oleiagrimonas sp. C23AA]
MRRTRRQAAPTTPATTEPAWHTLDAQEAVHRLESHASHGLTPQDAQARLASHGVNQIRQASRRGVLRLALAQFTDLMVLILLAAAGVAALAGDTLDASVILAIVVLNAGIGWLQSVRAERAIEELRRLAALHAQVVRGGETQDIAAAQLVPGDLVVLEAGAAVPADIRLLSAHQLRIDESALTGESVPVDKTTAALHDPAQPLAERTCMVFKGSAVSHGRGRGVVVATGMHTELGHIASLLAAVPPAPTPLQRRLARFGRQLALAVLGICLLVFATGLLRGEPPVLMLLTALSLAVAAIPEALPAVVTMMLALGTRSMAARHALVRRLPAVETLGSVSCICTDKTGTLTCNVMQLAELTLGAATDRLAQADGFPAAAKALLRAAALCNDAHAAADGDVTGDPTEVALWRAADNAGLHKTALEHHAPRSRELPFDADRKRMTTVHHVPHHGYMAYTKGAPESMLERCTRAGGQPLDAPTREALLTLAGEMAADGLRVMALAQRAWPALPQVQADEVERDMELLGLVGLQDPPRPEAGAAVATCRTAGIEPVMITGDHPATAKAIAQQLGMFNPGERVLTGRDLGALSDERLAAMVDSVRIYARVDPAQKIRIVRAIAGHGRYVAMTGDGVNDAPALAAADIGVAMGRGGTDVAREAASLVLLDDNFATIVAAVEEGRRIFDNVRKFVRYVLGCNSAEILVILLAPLLGLPTPLLPSHILWINLVTDGLPGLALATEPAERGIMRRPPRPPRESLFAGGTWQHIVWAGLAMAVATLLTQAGAVTYDVAHWQTMTFTVLALAQLGQAMVVRSEHSSLFAHGFTSNRPMLLALAVTVALQLLAIYLPIGNRLLHTAPLSASEMVLCIVVALLPSALIELIKSLRTMRRSSAPATE